MKSFSLVRSVLVVSLVCLAGTVRADSANLITNGGFTTDVSGWVDGGGQGVITWNSGTDGSPGGASVNIAGSAWLQTFPGATLVVGQTYTVSFLAALLSQPDGGSATLLANAGDASGVFSGGQITPTLTSTWQQYSYEFTTTAADVGGTYVVEFCTPSLSTCGIDSVSLTTIPEPSTLVLLGVGLFGLLAYAWRKRK